ncbi:MAG: YbhB/YbcL family Raf kinase inhibitor-like protein [Ignavibacteriales bacterium]|nr:YbhB/YbcL family Raf kinase inhibitor-like protein [Ignavibacteriales bacterium]
MNLKSSAFEDDEPIPTKYAHSGVAGGRNISIPLEWENPPEGTKSFALSIIDPHPVARNWIHWLAVNIPVGISVLAEDVSGKKMPSGSKELYNSYGELGYGGPQPPKGSGPHPYVITLYALDVEKIDLTANSSLTAFEKTIDGKVITSSSITGIFER